MPDGWGSLSFPGPVPMAQAMGVPRPLSWLLLATLPVVVYVAPTAVGDLLVFGLGLASVVLVPLRLRTLARGARPFWYAYAGSVLLFASAVVRAIHAAVDHAAFPFPSPADAFALTGYLLVLGGLLSLARARRSFGGQGDVLDVVLLAAALAGPFWVGILDTYFADPAYSLLHRGLTGAYAVTEVAFVAVILRLAAGPGVRCRSYWYLAITVVAVTVLDAVAILDTVGRPGGGLITPLGALVAASFIAAVAQDDLERLTERPPASDPSLTRTRMASLGLTLAMIPTLLVVRMLANHEGGLGFVVAFVALLSLLVLIRIVGLLRARDRIGALDITLREVGRELIAASNVDECARILARTLGEVIGPQSRFVAVLHASDEISWIVDGTRPPFEPASTAVSSCDAPGSLTEIRSLLGPVADEGALSSVVLGNHGSSGAIVVDPGRPLENAQQLALQTMGAQLAMALSAIELREIDFRRRSARRLAALVEQSADVALVLDEDQHVTFASPNAQRVLDRSDRDLVGRGVDDLFHPGDRDAVRDLVGEAARSGISPRLVEARIDLPHGGERWFALTARDFRHDPEVGGIVLTARDITEERTAKLALERSERWFRGLVQHSSDVIAVLDDDGVFNYVSPAVETLLARSPESLQGHSVFELLTDDQIDLLLDVRRELAHSRGVAPRTVEVRLRRADGAERVVEVTLTDRRPDPGIGGIVLNIRDVTDRKRLEEDLRHRMERDTLTALHSRHAFVEMAERALAHAGRTRCGMLFIDLDDFKRVNDTLGHEAGDLILVQVAERIREKLRLADGAARFSGDEFAILLTDVYGDGDMVVVAERVLEELARPFQVGGEEIRLTASIGIADDTDAATAADLLRAADVAMYRAKSEGKGRWARYSPEMTARTARTFEIANALGAALEKNELTAYFQPIVDLATGRTVGAEALVRWIHPRKGVISPVDFIPVAESNGMIVPLGRQITRLATEQAAAWRRSGHDVYVSINLSPVQLRTPGEVERLLDLVDETGLPREAVVFELTETALIDDRAVVESAVAALRRAGTRVAIDDFGTGYANLSYVQDFPADILKIDRAFVTRLGEGDDTLVRTMLDMARAIGARTVAEGVETNEEFRHLRRLGCPYGQGYFFARPRPGPEVTEALDRERAEGSFAAHRR
ncbi:MAG: EAL domain-containing protein [Actinomyces sp.]|nr:MAG: EAL domain-containing protein [Actinomyces sp.]